MSIRSKAFKNWATGFLKREAFRGLKTEVETVCPTGRLISSTIEKLKGKFVSPTSDLVINNLLYACYQADAALSLKADPAETRRERFRQGHKSIGNSRQELSVVAKLFKDYPEVLQAALSYPDAPVGFHDRPAQKYAHTIPAGALIRAIAPALQKIIQAHKVSLMNDDITFSDLAADCQEGQFLHFHRRENRDSKPGPCKNYRRLVEDGLIFHLTYIFRYFTGGDKDQVCVAYITKQNELLVGGSMLRMGKSNEAAVAHLVNAVMKRNLPNDSLSGRDIKERLQALLKPSISTRLRDSSMPGRSGTQPFSDLEFIGWPTPAKSD